MRGGGRFRKLAENKKCWYFESDSTLLGHLTRGKNGETKAENRLGNHQKPKIR